MEKLQSLAKKMHLQLQEADIILDQPLESFALILAKEQNQLT